MLGRLIPPALRKLLADVRLYRQYAPIRVPNYRLYQARVRGKRGIEIGGPSAVFKTVLPLYPKVSALDGANFAGFTVWEGQVREGRHYNYFGNRRGMQLISEAAHLPHRGDDSYDFVLSSHCLEHVANPLCALREWKRITRPGGTLVLVLPHKITNFDHRRPFTTFAHLLEDLKQGTTEHDLTHLEEILALHDLALDPPAGTLEQFRRRSLDNFHNRTLHHHVFDPPLIREMLAHTGYEMLDMTGSPEEFYVLAANTGPARDA